MMVIEPPPAARRATLPLALITPLVVMLPISMIVKLTPLKPPIVSEPLVLWLCR